MSRFPLIGALFCLAILGVPVAATAADLVVHVTDIRNDKGQIRFALFDKPAEFPEGKRLEGTEVAAHNGQVTATFKNLPPGTYAVAIHHDENGDEKMNTALLGIPKEGYGFSNDARVVLGPPTFAAASFAVNGAGAEITLRMQY